MRVPGSLVALRRWAKTHLDLDTRHPLSLVDIRRTVEDRLSSYAVTAATEPAAFSQRLCTLLMVCLMDSEDEHGIREFRAS